MESPIVSMAPMRVTKMKAGRSAQKEAPKEKSSPGQPVGMPIQPAFATGPKSKMPVRTPTVEPTATPMIGAQRRQNPLPRSASPAKTARAAPALSGAASGLAPSGTSPSSGNRMGITVAAISMMTIPATVGVITRRSQASRKARPNWNREETRTSTASSAGPPSRRAATEIAMKAPEVPMSRTCPAPNRPTRFACRMVDRPHTVSAAKTAQER